MKSVTIERYWRPEVEPYLRRPTEVAGYVLGKNIKRIVSEALRDHVGCLLEQALEENNATLDSDIKKTIQDWLIKLGRVKK